MFGFDISGRNNVSKTIENNSARAVSRFFHDHQSLNNKLGQR